MTYTAKAAVCFEIRTKQPKAKRAPCGIFECKPGGKPLGLKRLGTANILRTLLSESNSRCEVGLPCWELFLNRA
jgi:hypothetical protein